jgi:hypothetical protein
MGLFGKAEPKRIIVKEYGRSSFLGFAVLPLAIMLGRQGMERRHEVQVLEMESDAAQMSKQGYRLASSQEYTLPLLSISYLKVTYELVDPPD